MATLHLEIITPDQKAYGEDVDQVVIPTSEGEIGVMPHHVPLVTLVKPGDLRVTRDGEVTDLAVGEGFAEIGGKHVTILTDMALTVDQIDESKVEKALESARDALAEKSGSPEDQAALMAEIQKSMAQLNVKRRRRTH